jgi:hypothetical protein
VEVEYLQRGIEWAECVKSQGLLKHCKDRLDRNHRLEKLSQQRYLEKADCKFMRTTEHSQERTKVNQ